MACDMLQKLILRHVIAETQSERRSPMKRQNSHPRAYHYRYARGQLIVLATLGLIALIGIVGLAVDIGYFYSARRQMQTAADAAAIAGTNAQLGSQGGSYQQAALDVASLNGFTNGQNGVIITVGPPATPPNPTNNTYVEVDIAQPVPTTFLSVIGYKTINVSVRAVAGFTAGPSCLYVLDRSAPSALSLNGNFNVNASCGILVDSSNSAAFSAVGNGSVTAQAIGVAGNYSATGNVKLTPTPHINIAPAPDPLASLQPPAVGNCTQQGVTNSGSYTVSGNNQVVTVPPGVYAKGVSISGNSAVVTFSAGTYGNNISIGGNTLSATFNPGQYQNGGSGDSVDVSGNSKIVFNPGQYTFCGAISITGNNNVTLSPGLYSGGISITGNATVAFNPGTYILAGGGMSVTGNSTLTGTGVTFYNTTGPGGYQPIDLAGNETAQFSAPTSGALEGILFFQDRSVAYSSSNGSTVVGNSSSTFDGVVYFPTTSVTYVGNSSSQGYTFLIGDKVTVSGNASITLGNNYSSLANGSPIKTSALYE
jgi:Flp pilus assembly protein TadG